MGYEIVKEGKKMVMGVGTRTTNENMRCVKDAGEVWHNFFENGIFGGIDSKASDKTIGLYTEYDGDFTKPYCFYACCEVIEFAKQEKLMAITIPEGKYAKFSIHGVNKTAVGTLWQEIWSTPLDREYSSDFEVYHNDLDEVGEQTIDIYIGIR